MINASIHYLVSSQALLARKYAAKLATAMRVVDARGIQRAITGLYDTLNEVATHDGVAYEYLLHGITGILHAAVVPPREAVFEKVRKRKLKPRRQQS